MTTEADFLRAVLADPDDDGIRLQFSDWLEENGREEQAAFVRVQITLARRFGVPADGSPVITGDRDADREETALRRRARDLLNVHWREWFAIDGLGAVLIARGGLLSWCRPGVEPAAWSVVMEGTPRRGFVDAVTCTAEDWLRHADAVLAAQPVLEVTLTGWQQYVMVNEDGSAYRSALPPPPSAAQDPFAGPDPPTVRRGWQGPTPDGVLRRALAARWTYVRTWHLPPDTGTRGPAEPSFGDRAEAAGSAAAYARNRAFFDRVLGRPR